MNLDYIIEMCFTVANYTIYTIIVLSIIGVCGQHINHFQNIDKILNNTKDGELIIEIYKNELETKMKIINETMSQILSNTKVDKDPNIFFNVIVEFTDDLRYYLNKFLDDSDIFDLIMNFIYNWNDLLFLSQLSIEELNALSSLTSAIVILMCTLNIISVLFPNFLIKFIQLENKFTKLMDIIKLRRNLNLFYLIIFFLIIISLTLGLIFINLLILIY
jgi:hypothetical protein